MAGLSMHGPWSMGIEVDSVSDPLDLMQLTRLYSQDCIMMKLFVLLMLATASLYMTDRR